MKNIISTLILALLFTSLGFSQTNKGGFIVGGSSNLSFTSNKSKIKNGEQEQDGEKTLNVAFGPAAGYFVINNLAVGLQLPISYSERDLNFFDISGFPISGKNKTTSIVAVPFLRYYFSDSNIKPFLQGSIGLGSSKSKFNSFSNNSEGTSSIFIYGFDGGIAIFISPNVSVDLGLGYASTSNKPKDSSFKIINEVFGFNAGVNIFL